ncbi:MAG: peptidoglycan-binding domain-containing protein [Myxococcales bacterium]
MRKHSTCEPFNDPSGALVHLMASALLFAIACGHTHNVGDTTSNTTPPADEKTAAHGPRGRPAVTKAGAMTVPGRDGAPPLATTPAGLLKPHAVESIQEKLASIGRLPEEHETGTLDGPTRQALREFQRSNNLPATGMPDDVTIQKLGLGTQEIFRASENPAK